MRNSIFGFNQEYATSLHKNIEKNGKENTLSLDINDLAILRWLIDFSHTGRMETISIGYNVYYWISYDKVIEDLPLLNIGKDMLYRRLKKMVELEILSFYSKNGSQSYFGFGKNYENMISNEYHQNSEGSEKIPSKVGKNSECRSEKIPSNSILNNSILNKKENITYSNIKEKEKHRYGEYGRILLTDNQYENLIKEYGKEKVDIQIQKLDEYIQSNDNKNKYKDFNLVLRKSIRENWFNNNIRNSKKYKPNNKTSDEDIGGAF